MNTERIVRAVAGSMVLVSVLLSRLHSVWWLAVTVFVGVNLFQSAFSRWCLLEDLLAQFGVRRCCNDAVDLVARARGQPASAAPSHKGDDGEGKPGR